MADTLTFFRNYNYDACLAKGNVWTVAEAVDYLAAYLTNKENWYATADAQKAYPYIRYQLFSAVKQSVEAGRLLIHEEYMESGNGEADAVNYAIDFNKSTVNTIVFISWAINNNFEVPKQFAKYAAMNRSDRSDYYEGLGLKRIAIHHERCRAVAELLWSMEPEVEIARMAQRSEITNIGCEGHVYDVRTVCRWLANLKADRRPGRHKKE